MKQYYKINQSMEGVNSAQFVRYWDEELLRHMKNTARAVSKIPNLRLIGLTGPTCSGKTTAARILTDYLECHGHRVHVISLDDFFYDTENLERSAEQDRDNPIDFDSEDTINSELFADKIQSLMAGLPTKMPRFDFKTGKQVEGEMLIPGQGDVFLVEGIQVLYPKIAAVLRGEAYRSIYICASSAIEIGGEYFEPNDIRLMRRIVRDFHFRASPPEFTFYLWQSVRVNEDRSIFPNVDICDYVIDSTMPYEIGMLKPYLHEIIGQMNPKNSFYPEAEQLLSRLDAIDEVSAEYIVPNSLYKEFI